MCERVFVCSLENVRQQWKKMASNRTNTERKKERKGKKTSNLNRLETIMILDARLCFAVSLLCALGTLNHSNCLENALQKCSSTVCMGCVRATNPNRAYSSCITHSSTVRQRNGYGRYLFDAFEWHSFTHSSLWAGTCLLCTVCLAEYTVRSVNITLPWIAKTKQNFP